MIENKYICFKKEETFLKRKSDISDTSVVFVLDKQYIYSHGTKFDCKSSGDGKIIVYKSDGTSIGSFTVNQSGNTNIILPDFALKSELEESEHILSESVGELNTKIKAQEDVVSEALRKLDEEKLGKDELDVDAINNDMEALGKSIISNAESKVNTALDQLKKEIDKAGVSDLNNRIDGIENICASGFGDVKDLIETQGKVLGESVNFLLSKIKNLQEQIDKLS